MALTAWDFVRMSTSMEVGAQKNLFFLMVIRNKVSYNYPQHSFLHNFLEGAGQVAEEVAPELLHVFL